MDRKKYLIFVMLAVFVSGLSLLLKGNDDKIDEDILALNVIVHMILAPKNPVVI